MKQILLSIYFAGVLLVSGCAGRSQNSSSVSSHCIVADKVLPVTGTFINLPYQDVRNKYTNPAHIDTTDPQMWAAKIAEMKKMGMEYLVFMSVANEGKA